MDAWVTDYNADRPHQGLDPTSPVVPADRFTAAAPAAGVELWLPPTLEVPRSPRARRRARAGRACAGQCRGDRARQAGAAVGEHGAVRQPVLAGAGTGRSGGAVLDRLRVGPPHDRRQRIKSLRSRFSVNDLDTLVGQGAVPAGPRRWRRGLVPDPRRPHDRGGRAHRGPLRDRVPGQRTVLAAEILAGRRVGIYIEEGRPLLFFDLETRELLRTRPNPLEPGEAARLQRCRPVGPVPRPSTEPITVQRRASNTGVIMVAGQKVALGREHKHRTVTVHVSETTLAIDLPGADEPTVRRTTTQPVRSIKGQRPRSAEPSVS